jgi:hypothetical protein
MITNPNTCGLFEPDLKRISDAVHAAGSLCLLRRRQLQRHRRPGPPRRPGRRCHAHQPAQDLLHPARRWRAGLRPGGVLSAALAPFAPIPFVVARPRPARNWCRRGGHRRHPCEPELRPDGRLPRPDGHVRPRAGLHDEPWRRRPAPGRRGCGAERQLHPCQPEGCLHRAVRRERPVHARGAVRRQIS